VSEYPDVREAEYWRKAKEMEIRLINGEGLAVFEVVDVLPNAIVIDAGVDLLLIPKTSILYASLVKDKGK
jgi:hypothetical protein